MSTDSPNRRQSKRRSSFMPNRMRLHNEEQIGDFSEEKPLAERMAQLARDCLDYSLEKLGEEMQHVNDYQNLKRELRNIGIQKIEEIETETAKTENYTQPEKEQNPYNIQLKAAIADVELHCENIHKEMGRWEELVTESQDKLSDVQRESERRTIQESQLSSSVKELSDSYLPIDRLDLQRLATSINNEKVKLFINLDRYREMTNLLQRAYKFCANIINQEHEKIVQDSEEMDTMPSPRQQIEALTMD